MTGVVQVAVEVRHRVVRRGLAVDADRVGGRGHRLEPQEVGQVLRDLIEDVNRRRLLFLEVGDQLDLALEQLFLARVLVTLATHLGETLELGVGNLDVVPELRRRALERPPPAAADQHADHEKAYQEQILATPHAFRRNRGRRRGLGLGLPFFGQ